MTRPVALRNAHPRLKVPHAAVARMIALLDERFELPPSDLPHLSLPPKRLAALRSQVSGLKSQVSARLSPVPAGELSLVFLTDPALAKIHADFMDDPTATDVITFEGDPAAGLAGEICVSADTAARYVGLLEGPAPAGPRPIRRSALHSAFATELTLYLVHGWLHLAGYDDLLPARKRRMRAAEARAMKLLAAAKAIPAFRLAR